MAHARRAGTRTPGTCAAARLREVLDEHLFEPVTLADLTKATGLSVGHASRASLTSSGSALMPMSCRDASTARAGSCSTAPPWPILRSPPASTTRRTSPDTSDATPEPPQDASHKGQGHVDVREASPENLGRRT